ADGSINYAFDASGYKTIIIGTSNTAGSIIPYGQDYLVTGVIPYIPTGLTIEYKRMFVAKINSNGAIDVNFGINGFKEINLDQGSGSNEISDVQLSGDKLFVLHYHAWSFLNRGLYLLICDLNTEQTISDVYKGLAYNYTVKGDKVYSTKYQAYTGGTPIYQIDNVFNITRQNLDGTPDNTFCSNGTYSYEFPYLSPAGGASASYCFAIDESDRIVIVGQIDEFFTATKLGMLRIETSLSVAQNESSAFDIYPNPFDNGIELKSNVPIQLIEVFDLTGRKVAESDFTNHASGIFEIDLSNITQSGAYILKVYAGDKQIVEKIIKR
ncbi:MAG TPA: T9SS type A sorting domain-containing protein, partial [Flavobacterium sp.]|nr:T9SS type A sorting domain-containing protein [Flavobacterium sp.]